MSESLVISLPFIISVLGFVAVVVYNVLRGVRTTREALGAYLAVVFISFAIGIIVVAVAKLVLG